MSNEHKPSPAQRPEGDAQQPQRQGEAMVFDRLLVADMLGDLLYDDGYGMKSKSAYTVEAIAEQMNVLRVPTPTPEPQAGVVDGAHSDDVAVDLFATSMKAKLADARAKGRGGWDDDDCTQEHLSNLLRGHVDKGDSRDVANFACFLWNRGERIAAATPALVDDARDAARYRWLRENPEHGFGGGALIYFPVGKHLGAAHWREALDAAIDAALRANDTAAKENDHAD